MRPRSPLHLALTLGLLTLASCGEDTAPTQPGAPGDQHPTTPELAWASNSWTTRATMPTGRHAHAAAVAYTDSGAAILYAIGGLAAPFAQQSDVVEAYNYTTNSWTTKAPLPVRLYGTNGVGVIGGKLYLSGGVQDIDQDRSIALPYLFVYNPQRDTWTRKANLPHKMSSGVTGVINGKLYVLPGVCTDCSGGTRTRRFYRYDPAMNAWSSLPWAPHQHAEGAGGVINGKFYVAGGYDSVTTISLLDVYDPVTNKWTTKAPMPTVRAWISGAVLNKKLFILGGQGAADLATVEAYDPATNTWTTKAPMPTPREQLAAATITVNGNSKILAAGGLTSLDVNEAYKP
ncbi:MAG: Kelch repeat-containing protein [Gemmatimonadales bacterium]